MRKRFTLRSLLVMIALSSAVFAWIAFIKTAHRNEELARSRIETLAGGSVDKIALDELTQSNDYGILCSLHFSGTVATVTYDSLLPDLLADIERRLSIDAFNRTTQDEMGMMDMMMDLSLSKD
jgi:hypothetical protein